MARSRKEGFTLIELLIVVAIIAILAAIAVPNFLEAQTRSKVARVKNDQRALQTAAEAYYVDHNEYPPNSSGPLPNGDPDPCAEIDRWMEMLSTPVAYIVDSRYPDPFGNSNFLEVAGQSIYFYLNLSESDTCANLVIGQATWPTPDDPNAQRIFAHRTLLASGGPDGVFEVQRLDTGGLSGYIAWFQETEFMVDVYDPTNGTISGGDIYRTNRGFTMAN
jgi:prepilin-type N-terminal cleavage/methylation domain-containing protein